MPDRTCRWPFENTPSASRQAARFEKTFPHVTMTIDEPRDCNHPASVNDLCIVRLEVMTNLADPACLNFSLKMLGEIVVHRDDGCVSDIRTRRPLPSADACGSTGKAQSKDLGSRIMPRPLETKEVLFDRCHFWWAGFTSPSLFMCGRYSGAGVMIHEAGKGLLATRRTMLSGCRQRTTMEHVRLSETDQPTIMAYRPRPAKRIRLLSGSRTMNVRAPHGSVFSI